MSSSSNDEKQQDIEQAPLLSLSPEDRLARLDRKLLALLADPLVPEEFKRDFNDLLLKD